MRPGKHLGGERQLLAGRVGCEEVNHLVGNDDGHLEVEQIVVVAVVLHLGVNHIV